MSQEAERVYTINLGKVLLSPDNQRAKRAINMIKEFTRRHMKTEEVKLEEDVSHLVWSRGIRRPPRKIRVRMTKTDEGYILISKYEGEEIPTEKDEKKTKPEKIKSQVSKLKGILTHKPEPEPESIAEPDAKAEPEPVAKPDAKSDDAPDFFKEEDTKRKPKRKPKN